MNTLETKLNQLNAQLRVACGNRNKAKLVIKILAVEAAIEAIQQKAIVIVAVKKRQPKTRTVYRQLELKLENAPIKPISIESVKIKARVKFPEINKNNTIEEYLKQYHCDTTTVIITEKIILSDQHFEEFKHSLLSSYDWLKGKGGEKNCLLVTSASSNPIVVDPQGFDYARYVGFIRKNSL